MSIEYAEYAEYIEYLEYIEYIYSVCRLYRVYKVFSLIGVTLAVVMSWQYNHSVLWAIVHGCFGWLYVFYAWMFK